MSYGFGFMFFCLLLYVFMAGVNYLPVQVTDQAIRMASAQYEIKKSINPSVFIV